MHTQALAKRVSRLEARLRTKTAPSNPMLTRLRDNPALTMRAAGMRPDPWQATLLQSSAEAILLLCSRQAGKSTAAAALALSVALLTPRALVLLLSPSLRQSGELFRKVLDLFNALKRPLAVAAATTLRLELTNGSRIISLPGQEETIRGFSGVSLLIIDEAARVADELYKSVRPMLAVSQGRLVALSTPFGKRGWFYEEWTGGGQSWQRVRVTADQCPRIPGAFLEEEKRALGDIWYRQEYLCSFETMAGLVYPEFDACVIDPCQLRVQRAWAGCDFGWNNPSCFLVLAMDDDDVLYLVDEVYCKRMTDEELAGKARALCEQWPIELVYCDGANPQSIQKLRRADLPAVAATKALHDGIRAVGHRLRTGRLKCFRTCVNTIREAGLYHYDPERKLPSDDPVKEHDHSMDALRYAVSGIDRISEVHGVQPRPQPPEPAPDPDPETDYRLPVPQERYQQPYRRLPSGRMVPPEEYDRQLPLERAEDERQRQANADYLWTHGWVSGLP